MSQTFSDADIEEEQKHFSNVIATFQQYAQYSLAANNRRRKDIYTLSQGDKELLDVLGYRQKLQEVDRAILDNAEFLKLIVANPEIFGHDLDFPKDAGDDNADLRTFHDLSHGDAHSHSHGHPHHHSHSHDHENVTPDRRAVSQYQRKYKPTDFDMDKLRSTLKQFVRDWSQEGKEERDTCYTPIKDALVAHFSDKPSPELRQNIRVLVPGAGLGRLAYDVANLGFACQGNEFSHYMLLASYLILNRTDAIGQYTIYPYVHSFSNLPDREAMLRPVKIPDVLPSALPAGSNFPWLREIYGTEYEEGNFEPQAGQWDAVLTCFFIDTAKNIVNYLRIIHRILAPGGVWINMGPLLWHFENNATNDPSIELDLEEVKMLARKIGFVISDERTIDTTYTSNSRSMLGYVYKTAFWTATKA
ncbi:N2227-domain-containing protein [Suillus bovinus]|uniref:N2227-domain-containing protein n=1 Tax=Suillus bovinus TaxID=48563 RepID=UPI001B85F38E|nr:N2227-domain-containing protein [Suillus bovinus]XP_041301812.1 N2227-domain-containing protein [Suillus bovinus]KAG2129167.1 N2227-domain-containing protein [Suillus bovinus]KAG2129671.1 N2227-domain-containing protein [Suillus bovinus]